MGRACVDIRRRRQGSSARHRSIEGSRSPRRRKTFTHVPVCRVPPRSHQSIEARAWVRADAAPLGIGVLWHVLPRLADPADRLGLVVEPSRSIEAASSSLNKLIVLKTRPSFPNQPLTPRVPTGQSQGHATPRHAGHIRSSASKGVAVAAASRGGRARRGPVPWIEKRERTRRRGRPQQQQQEQQQAVAIWV